METSNTVLLQLNIDTEFRSLIPLLTAEEYAELEASIVADGCRDAIIVWDRTIMDGHNRYDICHKHSIEFKTTEKRFDSRDDAKIWIIRNQFARRNLNLYQRSVLELALKPLIALVANKNQGTRMDLCQNSDKSYSAIDTKKELAKLAGVSHDTIARVDKIEKKATPEQKEALRIGQTSINKVYRDIVRQERDAKELDAKENIIVPPWPSGKYKTIVIDPPWEIQKVLRDIRPNQSEFDYPTMTCQEISELPIANVADDACHLFLWTTEKYLPKAFEILEIWGFRYIFTMVWHKAGGYQPFGLPQYNCEFVLYGRKGSPMFIDTKNFPCCFGGKRREHSRKPDEFYELIRRVTEEPRIDCFSREGRDGFDQYGNEAKKF